MDSEEVPPHILIGCLWLRCPVSVTHCVPEPNSSRVAVGPAQVHVAGHSVQAKQMTKQGLPVQLSQPGPSQCGQGWQLQSSSCVQPLPRPPPGPASSTDLGEVPARGGSKK